MICIAHDDAYAKAVEWLKRNPQHIVGSWTYGGCPLAGCKWFGNTERMLHRPSILFRYAENPSWHSDFNGCLTLIRGDESYCAADDDESLRLAIRADERIPVSEEYIGPEHLEVFADWQRYLDDILDRERPVWTDLELVEV